MLKMTLLGSREEPPLMFLVLRWIGIIAGSDGILAPDFPINPFCDQFPSPLILEVFSCRVFGFFLPVMDAGRFV